MSKNKPPFNMNEPPEMPPPHEMGSFAAPLFPRKYISRRAETIVPRPFTAVRPLFMFFGIMLNFYIMFTGGLEGWLISYILWAFVIFLHVSLLAYCIMMAVRYYKIAYDERGESYSTRTSKAMHKLPIHIIAATVISAAIYAFAIVPRFLNADEGGWLGISIILFLMMNFWMMRARPDTMTLLTKEHYISGLYRVRYGDVHDFRVVGRALPGFGFNFKGEKKVFFEVYGEDNKYMGRDQIYEEDFERVEKIIKGLPLDTEYDKTPSVRRYAQKKKKKNPNKRSC